MFVEKVLALSAAAVVALCLGLGLLILAVSPPRPGGALAALSGPLDAGSARQYVETQIAQTPEYARFFARLREAFTPDYEATIKEFGQHVADTKTEPSVDYYLSEAVRRLRESHGALAAKAEPDAMSRVFARQLEVLQAVARTDKKLCVAFLYGATNQDFQRFAASQRALVGAMAIASLDAMVSGKAKNITRTSPTEEDFVALEKGLSARGLGKTEVDALLDGKMPDPPLDDNRMCAAGQVYLEVLKTLPEATRSRIYGLALELMAKS
jgi:hypothetical protein